MTDCCDARRTAGTSSCRPALRPRHIERVPTRDYLPAKVDTIDATLTGLETTLDEQERASVEGAFVQLFPRARSTGRAPRLPGTEKHPSAFETAPN